VRYGLCGPPRHFAWIVAVALRLVEYCGHEPTELRGRVNVTRHGFLLGFACPTANRKSTVKQVPASAANPRATASTMTISFVVAVSSLALAVS
jgi:hypothetical protein